MSAPGVLVDAAAAASASKSSSKRADPKKQLATYQGLVADLQGKVKSLDIQVIFSLFPTFFAEFSRLIMWRARWEPGQGGGEAGR